MKRIKVYLTFLILFLSLNVMTAETVISGTVTENGGNVVLPEGAGTETSLALSYSPENIDSYKIGFSTKPVSDFTEPTLAEDNEMMIPEGSFSATLSDEIYVFWQIVSQGKVKLYLEASSMENITGTSIEDLNVVLSTETVGGVSGDGINTIKVSTDQNAAGSEQTPILEFKGGASAGSQKITLVTESLVDKDYGTYRGTLTGVIKSI